MARESRTFEVLPSDEPTPTDDVEQAFMDWVDGLKDTDEPGKIRAFRIPLDEQGRASHSASGQVRLGTWPIDQYDFDTLCSKILKEFMLPNEQMMAVRLIGTLADRKGVRFNKIVMLQRPNATNVLPTAQSSQSSGLTDVLTSMQQGQERMMRLFQEMQPKPGEGGSEAMRIAAMMRVMMEPMTTMMGPMLAALAGRAPATGGASASMKETFETMMLMDRFFSRRGGEGRKSSDFAEIATAISGVAKPVLEMAATNMAANLRNRNRLPTATPVTQPVQAAPVVQQPVAAPIVQPNGIDLSRPSPLPLGSLAQSVDIDTPSATFPGDPAMFGEVKQQIDALLLVAKEGADPVAVANQFFEDVLLQMDDKVYGTLCARIEDPHYMTAFAAYNPQVREYQVWFDRMRARLVELIVAADKPDA